MTKDEALQMCLEYIETNAHERRCVRWAIKDALAQPVQPEQDFKTATKEDAPLVKWAKDQTPPLPVQPEQEPVAWEQFHEHMAGSFYKPPPQRPWAGLDHDELIERANQEECASVFSKGAIWGAARLREKNK